MRISAFVLAIGAVLAAIAAVPAQAAPQPHAAADFHPVSTSWQTPRHGYALGTASCGDDKTCTRLLTTTDGGKHWHRRTAPAVKVDNANPPTITATGGRTLCVDRYVDQAGKILKSTDGGRSWHRVRVATPDGQKINWVDRILVDHGTAYAMVTTSAADGDNRTAVYTMTKHQKRFVPRAGLSVTSGLPYGDITNQGGALQISLGSEGESSHYWYSVAGGPLHAAPVPCAKDEEASLGGLVAGRPVVGCVGPAGTPQPGHSPKHLAVAAWLGAPFTTIGTPAPTAGAPEGFAQTTKARAVFAATGGDLVLVYRTSDSGENWKTVFSQSGFAPRDLAFASRSVGSFVKLGAGPAANGLYRTTDAGANWTKINFGG